MKKLLFSLFALLLLPIKVYANSINSITMDIYINEDGTASITEVWDVYFNEGTEGYKTFSDLGSSTVENFTVKDDTNVTYTDIGTWNTNKNFSYKAYKSGLNYITDGIELCFGISKYGNRTYTLSYDITNFITEYTDVQGIYFNLLNMDLPIDYVYINISSYFDYSLNNSRIWGYGYDGDINFQDGSIIMEASNVSSSDYFTVLIRFLDNYYTTKDISNLSFDDIYDEAEEDKEEGYEYTTDTSTSSTSTLLNLLTAFIILILFNPILWIFLVVFLIVRKMPSNTMVDPLNFHGYTRIPEDVDIPYCRDIPCNKDLIRAYWVAYEYNIVDKEKLAQGLIGAILLKWVKDGQITVRETKKGLFSFKDNNYAIDLNNIGTLDNEVENYLKDILLKASGRNKILEAKELEKWCKKNYNILSNFYAKALSFEQKALEQDGIITTQTNTYVANNAFKSKKTYEEKWVNDSMYNEAVELKGLIKFLLDFSIMPEREYKEVVVWEEYLIFAELLGIADKVAEQFSKLYPEFKETSKLDWDVTGMFIISMAEHSYRAMDTGARLARERAARRSSYDYSGSSSHSGGGGSSSHSGGSSARGSSGGGAR